MAVKLKQRKTCANGHTYYKSSDCPTCPMCEQERKPKLEFLATLSAPARRALENTGILTIQKLATYSKKEILALHGIGPASIPALQFALTQNGLSFRTD
ncbi:MAG: RNA polymerase alpha subunit C-terminal domain-containing protein [Bacteroidota bacterium]